MKKLTIQVPTHLNDISLSQYQQFIKMTEGKEESVKYYNEQLVSIFCKLPLTAVKKIRAKDYEAIVKSLVNLLNKKPEFQLQVKHNQTLYGFIPNLEEITIGEQADCEEFLKDVQTLDKAMAVLYRPIKQKRKDTYIIEDYNSDNKGLDLPLGVVLGSMVFFSTLWNDLLRCTLSYIHKDREAQAVLSKTSASNGDGIKTSMSSLVATYLSSMRLLNYHYSKDCFTYHSKPILTE